jgi:hypothetical protein
MGRALKLVTGRVTNPGTTFTVLTPNTGDRFTVDNFDPTRRAYLVGLWAKAATAGAVRVRSPRLHDAAQGIRLQNANATPFLLYFAPYQQPIYPADILTVEMTGGAAETDSLGMLWTFEDLPGVDARFIDFATLVARMRNIMTTESACPRPSTAGDYGATRPINDVYDTIKANTDYAILGYVVSADVTAVAIQGPDTGNLRIGGPGHTQQLQTYNFFVQLSQQLAAPYIPVVNGNNKGSTLVQVVDNATTGNVSVNLILAELG